LKFEGGEVTLIFDEGASTNAPLHIINSNFDTERQRARKNHTYVHT